MRLAFRILLVSVICLPFHGCKKDSFDVPYEVIQLPISDAARSIYLTGDSLVAVGGEFNGQGFLSVTQLGIDSTLLLRTGFRSELYSITRQKSMWYLGGDSVEFYQGADLTTISRLYWRQTDWVSDLSKHPVRDMVSDETGVLSVAGGKLAFGVIYHSYDNGGSWDPIEPNNELRCADIRDGRAWVGGNGLMMRTEWGSAEWETLPLEGCFVVDMVFANREQGWAITDKGHVLESSDGGSSWKEIQSKKLPFMHRMASDGDAIVAVGEEGAILYRKDPQSDWKRTTISALIDLHDVKIRDGKCFVAADGGQVITYLIDDLK